MIKSFILKTAIILFLLNSCNKKKTLYLNDKLDILISTKKNTTRSIKSQKITEGFQSIKLPGSSLSISLLRLGQASDGSYWSVVKFPKGYHRSDSVFLGVEESYLMVKGVLKYSGISSPKGSYTIIPAEVARVKTQANEEVIAIARFSDKPFWIDKPKQKSIKMIEVNHIEVESNNDKSLDRNHSIITYDSIKVAYLKKKPEFITDQGIIVYSLTDSVIVEVLEGEIFPRLNAPFIIWMNHL